MIGKGSSIGHTANAIEYGMEKHNAIEIDRNLVVGETPQEIADEFKIFQDMNTRCENNSFSFVVSPSIEDSKNLSKEDYRDIAQDFMQKMDLHQQQYVAYLHSDKAHKHLHIYSNRIDLKGKATKDNYIGKKASRVAEEIAKERNFTIAKEVQKEKIKQLQKEFGKERLTVEHAHKKALEHRPKNIKEYSILMEKQGVKVQPKFAKNQKCVGIKFGVGEKLIKGSTIGKLFSGMNVQAAIINNLAKVIKINKNKSKGMDLSL